MGTVILIVSLGAALNLALWGAVYHKLRSLPVSVRSVIERNRIANETRALDVLQAAAASRLGGLVIGVQTYHEQLAGLVRSQVADAEVRARMTERRAVEAGIALDAASALVRELRTLTEDLPSLIDRRVVETDEERVSGDEELTMVQGHPLPGVQTLASAGASCGQGGAR